MYRPRVSLGRERLRRGPSGWRDRGVSFQWVPRPSAYPRSYPRCSASMTAIRKSSVGSVGFFVVPVPPHRTQMSSKATSHGDLGCPEPWQRGQVPLAISSKREEDRDAGGVSDGDRLTRLCQLHSIPLPQESSRSWPRGTLRMTRTGGSDRTECPRKGRAPAPQFWTIPRIVTITSRPARFAGRAVLKRRPVAICTDRPAQVAEPTPRRRLHGARLASNKATVPDPMQMSDSGSPSPGDVTSACSDQDEEDRTSHAPRKRSAS